MSLHLGNLSSRVRRDDLEHVFRRFGRCTVQVKDKFGFVVYDYPASAEKALKALRGKRICGEALTVSWSNRQPRLLQRFARGGKSFEPPRRKYFVREDVERKFDSNDQQDYRMHLKQADDEGRKLDTPDMVGESPSHPSDDAKGCVARKGHSPLNDLHGVGTAAKNHMEDDRWEEQVVDPSNEKLLENGVEFDRYEPYLNDDKKESEEQQNTSHLSDSPTTRTAQEKIGTGQHGRLGPSDYSCNPKSLRACYSCGKVGHEMHKCPIKLKSSRSMRKLHSGADVSLKRRQDNWEPSTEGSRSRLLTRGDSPSREITVHGRRKEFRDRKKNINNSESGATYHAKRAKGPSSSSIRSGYTSSRSRSPSRSLESLSPPRSKSKRTSVENKSPSSSSRSSPSRHSGSKTFKGRPISKSMSPASSPLPAEPGRRLSPSLSDRQTDPRDSVLNGLAQRTDIFEGETLVDSKSLNIEAVVRNECTAGTSKLEEEEMKKYSFEKDDVHCHSVSRGLGKVLESSILQSDEGIQNGDNLLKPSMEAVRNSQNEDLMKEDVSKSGPDVSVRSNAYNSARMSSEEIYMVLKHYGLQYPKENEKNLPLEVYFGSARSWPWEIIYYRRLKKGPISTENYARRLAQNEEFGIVDRYIRGSSGWGELNDDSS